MKTYELRGRSGFTLIEMMIVVAFIALMATMVLPRRYTMLESPMNSLRRAMAEVSDLALSGKTVRLRLDHPDRVDRGQILAEILTKVPDRFESEKFTLEWKPLQMRYPIPGEDWATEPEIIYFYADGTSTPARIWRAEKGSSTEKNDAVLLTVTGFLFEEKP